MLVTKAATCYLEHIFIVGAQAGKGIHDIGDLLGLEVLQPEMGWTALAGRYFTCNRILLICTVHRHTIYATKCSTREWARPHPGRSSTTNQHQPTNQTNRQTDGQTESRTDGRTDRQTDSQPASRPANIHSQHDVGLTLTAKCIWEVLCSVDCTS